MHIGIIVHEHELVRYAPSLMQDLIMETWM